MKGEFIVEKKRILLCCGAGMSSGFLTQALRKAAKKRKLPVEVKAVSESEVDSHLDKLDILLVGPHMTYAFDDLRTKSEKSGVVMRVIPKEIYGALDGEALLNFILDVEKES